MSMFYEKKQGDYPDIGQNNNESNPYAAKNEPVKSNYMSSEGRGGIRDSVFLKDSEQKEDSGCCAKCCKCCTIEYYKDYFLVDNDIVKSRILANLKFWAGGFFPDLKDDYDVYGPFWLYTTMVFICSAVHNLLRYMANPAAFTYNFQIVGVSFGIFYILGLALSILYGLIFGCMGLNCKTIHIVCLYGYALCNYTFCVILCIFNLPFLTWLFLLYGGGTKVAFILKNMFQKLEVPTAKKVLILVLVIAEAAVQLLAIKFALIVNYNATGGAVHFLAVPPAGVSHLASDGVLHLRSHPWEGL